LLRKEDFDVVHLESLFMTPYIGTIRRLSTAPIVLRSHNLEYVIWEKIAAGTSNFFKSRYLKYLTRKLKSYELSVLNEVSGIASISEEDKNRMLALGVRKRVRTIPFGVDLSRYPFGNNLDAEPALFHLGAMDWGPNLEGVLWFLNSIWPFIHEQYPHLKFYLAGRNMSEEITRLNLPNVVVVGEVDDAIAFMLSKAIMVVPLLSAGGVRVKIIEGLATGRAVIATSLGAEGLGCEHGKQLFLADRREDWIHALDVLLHDVEKRRAMAYSGREHVAAHFDIEAVTNQLINFYKEIKKA
jgi:glycosyltransferase involved in cell wall biosynthesis